MKGPARSSLPRATPTHPKHHIMCGKHALIHKTRDSFTSNPKLHLICQNKYTSHWKGWNGLCASPDYNTARPLCVCVSTSLRQIPSLWQSHIREGSQTQVDFLSHRLTVEGPPKWRSPEVGASKGGRRASAWRVTGRIGEQVMLMHLICCNL